MLFKLLVTDPFRHCIGIGGERQRLFRFRNQIHERSALGWLGVVPVAVGDGENF
jgi:hypothetical protein